MSYPNTPGYKAENTSKTAAEKITLHAITVREQVKLHYEGLPHHTFTADEVATYLRTSILTIRPRVAELAKMGLIEDSAERRTNDSGHRAIAWRWVTHHE